MASSARIDELRKKFDENPRRYFAPLANEYRKAGDLEEAIRICRAHLPQQTGHMSGHIVFGQALFESGQLDESREIFQAALALDPENLIALRHLGDIARAVGDTPAARMWYQRVLDADPRNEEIAGQLAQLEASPESVTMPPDALIMNASDEDGGGWGDINPEREQASLPVSSFLSPQPAPASGDLEPLDFEKSGELDISDLGSAGASATQDAPVPATPVPSVPEMFSGMDGIFGAPATPASAQPSAPSDIGLESMEFVPPPRHAAPGPVAGFSATHEDAGLPTGADETPAAFVTETMAELYLQQGFRDEALSVYRQLMAQNPHDASLRERVESLQRGDRSSISLASIPDNIFEAAHKRQSTRAVRTIRSFFGTLAGRRVARHAAEREEPPADELPESYAPAPPLEAEWQGGAAAPPAPAPPYEPPRASEPVSVLDYGGTHSFDLPPVPDSTREDAVTDTYDYGGRSAASAADAQAAPIPAFLDDRSAADDIEADEILPPIGGSAFAPAPLRGFTPPTPSAPVSAEEPPTAQPMAVNPRSLTPASASLSGTLDQLFSGADVSSTDQTAASALAGAFSADAGNTTPSGRPARAASTELSLDHVFRDTPQSQPARRSTGFSFDQFFSDGTARKDPTPGDSGSVPADRSTAAGGEGGSGNSGAGGSGGDIEQFHAWLEGLKKK